MVARIPYISYRPGAVFDDRKRFTETLPIRTGEADCCSEYDPVALHFPPQNVAIGYDLSNAGKVSGRTYDVPLSTVAGTTYAPYAEDRSAIYNMHDDMMYFLSVKTVSAVAYYFLVRFDPRALIIDGEVELPTGWTTMNTTLVDVADERVWLHNADTMKAYDTISLTEVFDDGDALALLLGDLNASMACRSGQLLVNEGGDATVVHLITVTGPTTYIDTPITVLDGGGGNNFLFSNNGSYRRRWIGDRNKAFLPYDNVPDGGIMYALVDLNDLTVQTTYSPAGASYDLSDHGPWWDHYGQRMVGEMNDAVGSDSGTFIGSDTGVTLGFANFNGSDWGGEKQTLGGTAMLTSQVIFALAGFSETTISNTPSEIFETSDSMVSPLTNSFDPSLACIAPRRRVLGALMSV